MDDDKKHAPTEVVDNEPEHHTEDIVGYSDRPSGWMYKSFSIFGTELWYASPKIQLLMIAIVCFLCPGMFNSLSGLGGAGQVDANANADMNTALYSTFAVVGFFAGTFTNRLGLRFSLSLGGIGYCIYSGSLLCYNHTNNRGFLIFAGAFLGVCAGLLWCAQGAIMMAYPREQDKGKYISWFWIIFNLGAVLGSLIPLFQNLHKTVGGVNDGTYAAFITLMGIGACISLMLCNSDKVIREDGTKVIVMKNPSWSSEIMGLWNTMYLSPWVLLLFPMFFCSNIFYTYQNNGLNGTHFNIRTRSLNGLLYWLAQIVGAVINGYLLDYQGIRRSVKAKISWVVLFVLTFGIWGGGYAWQKDQPSREVLTSKTNPYPRLDWTDGSKFLGPMFLYFFYGFYDAIWQTNIYWYMGALSNSGRKAANLAGFYKGIQSAGAAVYWALDGDDVKLEYMTMFASTWGLLAGSLLIAAPLILFRISDHISIEEDLKFSDETYDDVVVGAAEKHAV